MTKKGQTFSLKMGNFLDCT